MIVCQACGSDVSAAQEYVPGKLPNGKACDHRNTNRKNVRTVRELTDIIIKPYESTIGSRWCGQVVVDARKIDTGEARFQMWIDDAVRTRMTSSATLTIIR